MCDVNDLEGDKGNARMSEIVQRNQLARFIYLYRLIRGISECAAALDLLFKSERAV